MAGQPLSIDAKTAQRPSVSGPAGVLAGLLLAAGLLATAGAWQVARQDAALDLQRYFEERAQASETRLRSRLLTYEQMLRGVTGLFAASESVELHEFRAYVSALRADERYPGIQGIGFAKHVPDTELPAFLEQARRDGLPGYRAWPEGERPAYAPVLYLEPPSAGNLRAVGYDILSEGVRRAALEASRDTGLPALSGQIVLVVNRPDDRTPGAILFMPVYRNGAPTATLEERRAAILGWSYASFRIGDLMAGTFGDMEEELAFALLDGEVPDQARQVGAAGTASPRGSGPEARALHADRRVEVAGHVWTLEVASTPTMDRRLDRERPVLVALIGAGLSAALALLVWLLADGRARALRASRQLALDLEERHRAAAELEGSRRFTQATLDALPDEICVLDEAGTVISVNRAWRAFAEANGGRPEQLSEGSGYLVACRGTSSPDPAGAAFAERLERVLAGELEGFSLEYPCHAPGLQRWFVARVSRFDDRGQVRVLVAHQDVSALKAAGQALHVGEERLRLALASSRSTWWDHDVPRDAITVGEGWRLLTGQDPTTIRTLKDWLAAIHPDDVAASQARRQALLAGGAERFEDERRLRTADGRWTWARVRGEVTGHDAAGRPLRVVGTVTDTDQLHGLQDRLLEATRLASVGTLAAGVAHEINNPLAWIHSNLELALDRLRETGPAGGAAASVEVQGLLGESILGTTRIAEIVKAMRALGRPERAEETRPLDVAAELQRAVQMVRNQLQQRARLVIDVPEGLPAVQARTSELGRVFLNLLLNAAQAIPDGRPDANTIAVSARAAGEWLVVEVRDTGVGIAPEVKERLFDPFFTTKPVGQGTGLGLPIARSIVDAAGGRIEVESEPGQGAAFRVRLPATRAPAAAPAATPPPPAGPAPARRRVLLVDDEPAVAQAMSRWLGRHHEVTVLHSAAEVLQRIDAGARWDAMLVDLMMPGTDGVAFHDRLAATHPELLHRLAFLSGGAFGERATGFLATHEVPMVAKPARLAELLEVVDRLSAATP